MSPVGWLLVAAAVVLALPQRAAALRAGALGGSGRLAGAPPADGRGLGTRRVPWSALAVLGVGAATAAVTAAAGVLLGAVTAAGGAAAGRLARAALRGRTQLHERAQLLRGLRMLVAELQAGSRASPALRAAAGAAPRHAAVFEQAALAAGAAHDAAAVLCRDASTRPIGFAWRLGEQAGAPLADVLDRVAADLAAEDEQHRVVGAALAGPRASALVLALLPGLGLALGAAMGARPWDFLLGAPAGRAVAATGVLLDLAGVLWMQRILLRAGRP